MKKTNARMRITAKTELIQNKVVGILSALILSAAICAPLFPVPCRAAEEGVSKGAAYRDGEHIGKARGYAGEISVKVVIEKGVIKDVKVVGHSDDRPRNAVDKIPGRVLERQGTSGVDAVTGATFTSKGILAAVDDALAKASANPDSKSPAALREIKLPEPRLDPSKSLNDALKHRRTIRDFDPEKPLPPQTLSNLLWAAFGVNREDGKRTAPSAFNWQEITIFAATREGVFKYDHKKHSLIPVAEGDIRKICGVQSFVGDAPVVLIFVADYWRMSGTGGPRMLELYAYSDTGFISQNVYLFCASEGLGTVVLGGVEKEGLEKAIKIRRENQSVIFTQPVGYPKRAGDLRK